MKRISTAAQQRPTVLALDHLRAVDGGMKKAYNSIKKKFSKKDRPISSFKSESGKFAGHDVDAMADGTLVPRKPKQAKDGDPNISAPLPGSGKAGEGTFDIVDESSSIQLFAHPSSSGT
jgi:hypothetical protein